METKEEDIQHYSPDVLDHSKKLLSVPSDCPRFNDFEILRKDIDAAHSKLREQEFAISDLRLKDQSQFQRIDKIEQDMNEYFKLMCEVKSEISSIEITQQNVLLGINKTIAMVDKNSVSLMGHIVDETKTTEMIHKRMIRIISLLATVVIILVSLNTLLSDPESSALEKIIKVFTQSQVVVVGD